MKRNSSGTTARAFGAQSFHQPDNGPELPEIRCPKCNGYKATSDVGKPCTRIIYGTQCGEISRPARAM